MHLSDIVRLALEEDVGHGDVTTNSCVVNNSAATARIIAKQELVVSGHPVAEEVFLQVGATYEAVVPEGDHVQPGTVVARVQGPKRSLLTGERLALNFLMKLCGIATHTARTIERAGGLKVVDTRKTTPLLRYWERRSVRLGGGGNHRFALYDGVLIKNNHITAAGGLSAAVENARKVIHHLLKIEVEVDDLQQLEEALACGVDAILLDNMSNELLRKAVVITNGRAILEASGNMNAERLETLQGIGIDVVSMGGLIHQATWSDLSMRMDS